MASNIRAKFTDDIPTAIPNALQLFHPLPFCAVWHAILIESDLSSSLNVVKKVLSAVSVQKNTKTAVRSFHIRELEDQLWKSDVDVAWILPPMSWRQLFCKTMVFYSPL